jgi:DNA helicase-2/ATP-dependent DNA helicase PcrA
LTDPILDPLNKEQKKAVTHGDGPLLILAGAGSGKTRAITHRIAYLIQEKNVRPYRILGVTFTNKAADEMAERTRQLVGEENLQPELRTFHSFGVNFLRKEIVNLDRERNFTIYDDIDQRNVIKSCLEELRINKDQVKPRSIAGKISRFKDRLWIPDDYEQQASKVNKELLSIYRLYQEKLRSNNAYDFGDLIAEPVYLLKRNSELRERWQNRYDYLLVDEFQDTNPAQYTLAELLSEGHRNIAVVGDDDQSIYSWRGADISNILDFETDFPETKTIRLERNYRSTSPILDTAYQVIKNNTERKAKKLWTDRKEGHKPVVFEAKSDYDEAQYVVDTIKLLEKMQGIAPGDCAVFFRTNAQTRVFEEIFMREKMSYVIVSGVGFYERKEIKDLMAYLTMIVNPADDQAVQRIINRPTRGIGKKTMQTLFEYAASREESALVALPHLLDEDNISGRASGALGRFYNLYRRLSEIREETPIKALEKVLEVTAYIEEEVNKEDDATAESRQENIDELRRVADNFSKERAEPTLSLFVEEITLLSDVDTFDQQDSRVNLMTLHAAKGLEFPIVFMAGMEEGLLPHGDSDHDSERLEEERRLCYVGFTRAQDRLYCTWSRRRWMYGTERVNRPSQFLKEAGLIEQKQKKKHPFLERQKKKTTSRRSRSRVSSGGRKRGKKTAPDISQGDEVKHEKFGRGVVVSISGDSSSPVAEIRFQSVGKKRLALAFARLEKI